ncbi:ankyrin repeat-containing domain protein, partial [Xylaria longipes]
MSIRCGGTSTIYSRCVWGGVPSHWVLPASLISTKKGHTGIAAFLLANAANANAFDNIDRTALHWATESGHRDILGALLHHGADTKLMDGLGFRALHIAVEFGQEEFVKDLIIGGADPNSRVSD